MHLHSLSSSFTIKCRPFGRGRSCPFLEQPFNPTLHLHSCRGNFHLLFLFFGFLALLFMLPNYGFYMDDEIHAKQTIPTKSPAHTKQRSHKKKPLHESIRRHLDQQSFSKLWDYPCHTGTRLCCTVTSRQGYSCRINSNGIPVFEYRMLR